MGATYRKLVVLVFLSVLLNVVFLSWMMLKHSGVELIQLHPRNVFMTGIRVQSASTVQTLIEWRT